MPRVARRQSRTHVYHVIMRGINRQTIFEDEEDKFRFLTTLKKYKEECHYELYAYCLMDNHVHLLIKVSTGSGLADAIKRICSSYVFWYNWKYQRSGHLFQERYKSETIETKMYFLTVLRYIHQNPVKAGLASSVLSSKWTSMQEYLTQPSIISTKTVLQLFSSNQNQAQDSFTSYMNKSNDENCMEYTTKLTDEEVRNHMSNIGIPDKNKLQQMDLH